MTQQPRYTDFYNDLTIHPISHDVARVTDAASISNAIKNIVFTNKYERPFDANFGGGILATLFENMTSDTEFLIETRVKEAILRSEPRATNIVVQVVPSVDRNQYDCTIFYTPINSHERQSVSTILTRVR